MKEIKILAFLDVLAVRNGRRLEMTLLCKFTHADGYLYFYLNHLVISKRIVHCAYDQYLFSRIINNRAEQMMVVENSLKKICLSLIGIHRRNILCCMGGGADTECLSADKSKGLLFEDQLLKHFDQHLNINERTLKQSGGVCRPLALLLLHQCWYSTFSFGKKKSISTRSSLYQEVA